MMQVGEFGEMYNLDPSQIEKVSVTPGPLPTNGGSWLYLAVPSRPGHDIVQLIVLCETSPSDCVVTEPYGKYLSIALRIIA